MDNKNKYISQINKGDNLDYKEISMTVDIFKLNSFSHMLKLVAFLAWSDSDLGQEAGGLGNKVGV